MEPSLGYHVRNKFCGLQAVPKNALEPKLVMAYLKELVLTFLLRHLRLSEAQKQWITVPKATGQGTATSQPLSAANDSTATGELCETLTIGKC